MCLGEILFFLFSPSSTQAGCLPLRASNEGLLRPRVARARRQPVWVRSLFVSEHRQRTLTKNPVRAGKSYDQRQQHREEEADAEHLWVYAPGKVE
jgi:hypothetical protein